MMTTEQSRHRNLVAGLCSVLAFLLLLAAAFSAILRFTVFSPTYYRSIVCSDAYTDAVIRSLEEKSEAECLYFGFPEDTFTPLFSADKVKLDALNYADELKGYLINGDPLSDSVYCEAEIFATVTELCGAEDMDAVREITDEIADEFKASVRPVSFEGALHTARTAFFDNKAVRVFSKMYVPFFLPAAMLLLLVYRGKKDSDRYGGGAGVLFAACAVVFVPTACLKVYDLPTRLVLAPSPFASFVKGAIGGIVDFAFDFSLIAFSAATAVLIISVVYFVLKQEKSRTTEQA